MRECIENVEIHRNQNKTCAKEHFAFFMGSYEHYRYKTIHMLEFLWFQKDLFNITLREQTVVQAVMNELYYCTRSNMLLLLW